MICNYIAISLLQVNFERSLTIMGYIAHCLPIISFGFLICLRFAIWCEVVLKRFQELHIQRLVGAPALLSPLVSAFGFHASLILNEIEKFR